jgi:hypothetical protein
MRLNIPPIVPYVFGAMLVVFGVLRVKYLGAPRPPRAAEDDPETSTLAAPVRGPAQHRHLRWGVIYVLLGLFLVISTYVQTHRR